MEKLKHIAVIALAFTLSVSLCTSESYATDTNNEDLSNNLDENQILQEIDVSSAIDLIQSTKGKELPENLEDVTSAYMLEDGQIALEYHYTITDDCSSNTCDYVPIADNVNLFLDEGDELDDFSLQWAKNKDLSHQAAEGYGVVKGYQSDSDPSLWYLEMESNVRGDTYGAFVTKFGWEVSHDNNDTIILDYAPSGTEVTEEDGFDFSFSINLDDKGSVGASFPVFQKSTTITGGVLSDTYSLMLSHSPGISHPNFQDLAALVGYLVDGETEWSWSWDIWAYESYQKHLIIF